LLGSGRTSCATLDRIEVPLLAKKPYRAKVAKFSDSKYQTAAGRRLAEKTRFGTEEQSPSQNPDACLVQRGDALGANSLSA
jgi:hypothetical protein